MPGRDTVDMLDTGDARQHLLGRPRHQGLNVACRSTRERHQDIGHGDVDLRLFFLGCDERGENAREQQHQRNSGVDRIALELSRDAPGDAEADCPSSSPGSARRGSAGVDAGLHRIEGEAGHP